MAYKYVKRLSVSNEGYPEVVKTINQIALAEDRRCHDALRCFVMEAGKAKLRHPDLYREFMRKIEELENQSALLAE